MISGFVGGPAGTNYGENISTMAITKVFSIPSRCSLDHRHRHLVLHAAHPVIYGIPRAVIGGLEIYLFGAIALRAWRS